MGHDHRRLAAIILADVVGYSTLMGRNEGATIANLKAHRRDFLQPTIAAHRGRVVNAAGDSLLLEFASVVDAVRCAVAIQHGMALRNTKVPRERQIELRLGINLGDIVVDADEIAGDGVNIAARLQALAPPGGICVSRDVRDQVLDRLKVAFEDIGPQQVKNISRPIHVYRVNLGRRKDRLSVAQHARKLLRSPSGNRWLSAVQS